MGSETSMTTTRNTLTTATGLTISRMGYGAMQLAGPGVFGPPRDREEALAVLKEAVEFGVTHIDTADFYGPAVTNQLIREALHPYHGITIATKVGAGRGEDGSWHPTSNPEDLVPQVHDNLRATSASMPSTSSMCASAHTRAPPKTRWSPSSPPWPSYASRA
jgi:aryl-alcohol dehydrogenase-like predicted oxidoreductase